MTRRRETENDEQTEVTVPGGELYCPSCDSSYRGAIEVCPTDGTRLVRIVDRPDEMIGRNIDGRFEIRARIGHGGMGTVYRAWQHSIGREVAIKVIDQRYVHDRMGVRRFLREARLASQLSQPNTVSVFDFGQTEEGHLYLVMELLKGRTLDQVVREEGAFPAARTIRLGIQMCDALEAAHALAIVHRDLKPSNVIILDEPAGRDLVKVLDFGLAKSLEVDETESTLSGKIVGTPRYMAPEVALGEEAGPSSDLYSLGAILHEVATGRPLFAAPSVSGILAMKAAMPELSHALPPSLRRVLANLLDPEPIRRLRRADHVRKELEACRAELGGSTEASVAPLAPPVPATEVLEVPAVGVNSQAGTHRLVALDDPSESTTELELGAVDDVPAPVPSLHRGRSRARWLLGLAAVTAAGLAAALILGRSAGEHAPSPPPSTRATGAAPATPDRDAGLAAAQPRDADTATVELTLTSRPSGATVTVDGRDAGRTPTHYRISAGSAPVEVRFRRSGYRPARRQIVPDQPKSVDVTLSRRPRPTKKKKPPDYPF